MDLSIWSAANATQPIIKKIPFVTLVSGFTHVIRSECYSALHKESSVCASGQGMYPFGPQRMLLSLASRKSYRSRGRRAGDAEPAKLHALFEVLISPM